MTGAFSRQLLRQELPFFILATVTWSSLFLFSSLHSLSTDAELLFTLTASLCSFVTLKLLGYFDVVRLHPRKSDLLLVLCAMPFGGTLSYMLLLFSAHLHGFDFVILMTWIPVLSLLVFGGHHLLVLLLLRTRGRKKIVLDLAPREKASLLADFASLGMTKYLQYMSRTDLEMSLNNGTEHDISLIVISRTTAGKFSEDKTLLRAHLAGVAITDYCKISSDLTGKARLTHTDLWAYMLSATPQTTFLRLYSRFKTLSEPVIAVLLGILLAPVMLAIVIAIKLADKKGPVLYRQVRSGYLDRPFVLFKFRSMYTDAEANGPQWAKKNNDDRVTPVGRFLRRTRLDELPQLWNVISGEMGFFGPRPERPEIATKLQQHVPFFSLRTAVRPGVTGWAQVCAGYAASIEESREKLEYDLYYIQHMSPRLDLIILLRTVLVALFGSRAERRTAEVVSIAPAAEVISIVPAADAVAATAEQSQQPLLEVVNQ